MVKHAQFVVYRVNVFLLFFNFGFDVDYFLSDFLNILVFRLIFVILGAFYIVNPGLY